MEEPKRRIERRLQVIELLVGAVDIQNHTIRGSAITTYCRAVISSGKLMIWKDHRRIKFPMVLWIRDSLVSTSDWDLRRTPRQAPR